jgi:hypothetical protein
MSNLMAMRSVHKRFHVCASVAMIAAQTIAAATAQPLKTDPTPSDYVERNGSGSIVPAGKLMIDGHPMMCGKAATILDPGLNDYAASYPRFVILNQPLLDKVAPAVKLWIFSHECGHVSGIRDESQADCFGVRRGRREGWLTPSGLDQVCAFISGGQPDAMHFSGPDRCAIMRQCYAQDSTNAVHAKSSTKSDR